jgi:putrescine transport system ATP-binding protein
MNALALRAVAAGYGPVAAVSGIDLAVAKGEIFCLLGGSGSGKTTLLRCIAGFLAPIQGEVWLGGQDVTRLPPHRRDLTTLFQSYALFPHLSVADNIAFGLRRRGFAKGDVAARVAEMLALARLDGHGQRRINQLSGGQQQRVALARCLAPDPRLLLLDEPLSALDPELRAATRADLMAILRARGISAVLVTHDRAEAMAVADRIGLLHQGRLAQTGPPEALFERPATRFVAGFLGDVNLLDATVRESGAQTRLELPVGVVIAGPSDHPPGTKVSLGLRPELLWRALATGTNTLTGSVTGLVYAGATVEIALRLADSTALRMTQAAGLPRPEPGETVHVGWNPKTALVLAS